MTATVLLLAVVGALVGVAAVVVILLLAVIGAVTALAIAAKH